MVYMENINSKPELQQKIKEGKLQSWRILLILPLRLILAIIFQGITSIVFKIVNDPTPWQSAGEWWIVYGTLIDLGCLVAVFLSVRKEGIRIRDLISYEKSKLKRDILFGLLFYVIAGAISFGSIVLCGFLIYGVFPAPTSITKIHWVGLIYSFSIFPIFWAFTEEVFYNGFLFPRFEAITDSKWKAYLIVVPIFTIQHIALPLQLNSQALLYGAIWTLPLVLVIVFIYMKTRRLLPLIIMHYLIEIFALASAIFLIPS